MQFMLDARSFKGIWVSMFFYDPTEVFPWESVNGECIQRSLDLDIEVNQVDRGWLVVC